MRFIGEQGSFERHYFDREAEFERELYRFSDELFRGGYFVSWKPLLEDPLSKEGVKPDSLLVSLEYDEWWVIEVELGYKKKISEMIDQLGKLSRVIYSNYSEDLAKGLLKTNQHNPLTEEEARRIAKNLTSEPPKFLLIIDQKEKNMIHQASLNDFSTLIVHTYKNHAKQYRLALPEESTLTKELPPESDTIFTISKPDSMPIEMNNHWWYPIPIKSDFVNYESITLDDGKETFIVPIILTEDEAYMKLPIHLNSIKDIYKGNRNGLLFEEQISSFYRLKLDFR